MAESTVPSVATKRWWIGFHRSRPFGHALVVGGSVLVYGRATPCDLGLQRDAFGCLATDFAALISNCRYWTLEPKLLTNINLDL